MTSLWTVILILCVIHIHGQVITPNITLLSRVTQENNMEFTCVLGPNVRDSAATFITPLGGIYRNNSAVTIYKSTEGSVYRTNAYDCNFDLTTNCLEKWNRPDSKNLIATWTRVTSGLHALAPVTDERWESNDNQKIKSIHFPGQIRNLDISVRTNGEANILLCEEFANNCYWIILYDNKVSICSCNNINLNKLERNMNNCNIINKGSVNLHLSERTWIHIKLTISDRNVQIIEMVQEEEKLLINSVQKQITIKRVILFIKEKNTSKKGIWKLHDYNYLSLKSNARIWHNLGPSFQRDDKGGVCVALHVATCTKCTLKFRIIYLDVEVQIEGNRYQRTQQWHLVQLQAQNVPIKDYNLEVFTYGDGFSLIGEIRRCHGNETRVISMQTPMNKNDIVSCQALKQPNFSSSIRGGRIEQSSTSSMNVLTVCNNQTYTGSNCDVSCKAALGDNCNKVVVCEPSASRSTHACACAAGYNGEQCQDLYPKGSSVGCDKTCSAGDTGPECNKGNDGQQSQSYSNPALYALLLLLLIVPIVAWFAYRKFKKPANTIPDTVVSYTAVSTESNITITNVPAKSKPKPNNNHLLPVKISKEKNNNPPLNVTSNFILTNEIKDKKPNYSKIIKIKDFSNYVKESLENDELEKEYKLIPSEGNKPWIIGTSEENNQKNRYKNLTAYDHTRVVLDKIPGDPYSDFINASYIDGYNQNKAYIATQGPKKSTVDDFWRMIWQENVECIVMITNLVEEGKQKCEKYWPDIGKPQKYGLIHVTFKEADTYADFEYRNFKIKKDKTIRQVQQYHFTSWPDHGVPLYPQSLVPYLNRLLTVSPAKAPIVIHCSAGIGRTGTIILSDICLRMAAKENQIDILKYFHSMREQRVNMIAKYDQYVLVHMVLLECLLTPETSYPCIGLDNTVQEIIAKGEIKEQMLYLKNTAWHNQVMGVPDKDNNIKNASKNRFPDIVPSGRRMYLSKHPYEDETSDYINAVPVDGFRIKNQFIVTQNPLANTVKDFWRMIVEFNVKVIVSLNEIANDKFWPSENEEMYPLANLTVKCKSMTNESEYKIYKIKLEDTRERSNNAIKSINIMQLKYWKNSQFTPTKEDQLITLLEAAQKLPREDEPIVVTCYDGAKACGLYVALSFIIEKIKLEHICDVCLAVRTVRNNREQFVNDSKQFEFLYKAAIWYISTFELYSNFDIPVKK